MVWKHIIKQEQCIYIYIHMFTVQDTENRSYYCTPYPAKVIKVALLLVAEVCFPLRHLGLHQFPT